MSQPCETIIDVISGEGRLVLEPRQQVLVEELASAHAHLVRELWRRCVRGDEVFEKTGSENGSGAQGGLATATSVVS